MPKCKNCIHAEVCKLRAEFGEYAEQCEHFKDRSRFVEFESFEGSKIITLEDAIAHCYEVANGKTDACEECRAEHMMLGSWLRELKLRREQEPSNPLSLCDEVHFVLRDLDEISLKEYSFTVGNSAISDSVQFITEIGTYGFWVGESPREFAPDYDEFYRWYELGETVFLTREEAEAALKERKSR